MKYTILGFQQTKLIELDLKVDDALILRTVKDMYASASMEFIVENSEKYMWLNQKYFLSQIPIIGSRSTLLRRIDGMVEKGLLSKILRHNKKGVKGNFSYIKPTTKLDKLEDYDPYVKLKQGLCQDETRVMSERHNKDTSIRDTSIRDTTTRGGGKFKEIANLFQNNGFGLINYSTSERLIKLSEDYTEEWLLDAMDIAIDNNKRNLSYVQAILKRWHADGKDDGIGSKKEKSINKWKVDAT